MRKDSNFPVRTPAIRRQRIFSRVAAGQAAGTLVRSEEI
jgi:hypothetical protein